MNDLISKLTIEEIDYIVANEMQIRKMQETISIAKVVDYICKENSASKLMAVKGVKKCLDIDLKEAKDLVDTLYPGNWNTFDTTD